MQRIVRSVLIDRGEVDRRTGCLLRQLRAVQRQCRTDFRVTANGLTVIEQDDGLPICRNLYCALADALREYALNIAANSRTSEPVAHAIGALADAEWAGKKLTLLQARKVL